MISAHTHQPYICTIDGKLVTSAASFGRLVTDIDLVIDHQTKDIKAATAVNRIVTRTSPEDPAVKAILDQYDGALGPAREPGRRHDHGATSARRATPRAVRTPPASSRWET